MKQTQSGKIIVQTEMDITSVVLTWVFIVLVTGVVTTVWFDAGPGLGVIASIIGAIIAWRVS